MGNPNGEAIAGSEVNNKSWTRSLTCGGSCRILWQSPDAQKRKKAKENNIKQGSNATCTTEW